MTIFSGTNQSLIYMLPLINYHIIYTVTQKNGKSYITQKKSIKNFVKQVEHMLIKKASKPTNN